MSESATDLHCEPTAEIYAVVLGFCVIQLQKEFKHLEDKILYLEERNHNVEEKNFYLVRELTEERAQTWRLI